MFQQDLAAGRRLARSSARCAAPSRSLTLFVLLGGLRLKAWLAGLISLVVALARRDRAVRDAGRPGPARRHRGRGVRVLPDPVDRDQRDLGLQPDRRVRALRRAAAVLREGQPRPADPGDHHRVLLRRAARGAGRLRHAGRDHRRDADGAGLQAAQGRRRRADRQHRAGRVRCAGHPDRHAGRRSPPARATTRASPSTPSARWSAGRPRSWPWSCRWSWSSSSTAGAACARPGCRRSSAVSRSGSPSSSPPTTSRCRSPTSSPRWSRPPPSSLLLRVWQPGRGARRRAGRPRPRRGAGGAASVPRGGGGAGVGRRPRRRSRRRPVQRQRRRGGAGLRAVPRDHRDLLDHQHHRGQGVPGQGAVHLRLRLAGPRRAQHRGRAGRLDDVHLQLAARRRHPDDPRGHHHRGDPQGLAGARRCKTYVEHLRRAEVGDHHGDGGAGAGLRDEPVRPDHLARRLAGRRRRCVRDPLADPGLDRRRRHRLGHLGQRAVRRAAGADRRRRPGSTRC